jgi:hypothetical protein
MASAAYTLFHAQESGVGLAKLSPSCGSPAADRSIGRLERYEPKTVFAGIAVISC